MKPIEVSVWCEAFQADVVLTIPAEKLSAEANEAEVRAWLQVCAERVVESINRRQQV